MSDLSKTCGRLGDRATGIVLQARLADLDGYWLEAGCCGGATYLPLRLLARNKGRQHRLGDVLPRLRRKLCGRSPLTAWLNETPHRTNSGGPPPGWSVQLIPVPADIEAEAAE